MCTCVSVSVSMSVYVSCVSLDFDEDSIKRNPARVFFVFSLVAEREFGG